VIPDKTTPKSNEIIDSSLNEKTVALGAIDTTSTHDETSEPPAGNSEQFAKATLKRQTTSVPVTQMSL
jgi:hypothetical protein